MRTQVDEAFKFGCGRFILRPGAAALCGAEARALGCKNALVIGGAHTLPLFGESVTRALAEADVKFETVQDTLPCCEESVLNHASRCKAGGVDLIVGLGGGRVMDIAKLVSAETGAAVINIPTSSATCAAFTPLGVLYTPQGRALGSRYCLREVDCVLCDSDILARQPGRLIAAGIMDALAKVYEVGYYVRRGLPETADIATLQAITGVIKARFGQSPERLTAAFGGAPCADTDDAVFTAIAVTGMASGIARGKCQSALGHALYEAVRYQWPACSARALHGEIVALGLLVQERCLGESENARALEAMLRALSMPLTLGAIGVHASDAELEAFCGLHFFQPFADAVPARTLFSVLKGINP